MWTETYRSGSNVLVLWKTSCTVSHSMEVDDVQVRTRFRRCYQGETQSSWLDANRLAARSGTGERFIVELESGKPSCQLEKALIVARTVGIEIGDLRTVQAAPSTLDDDLSFLPTFGAD